MSIDTYTELGDVPVYSDSVFEIEDVTLNDLFYWAKVYNFDVFIHPSNVSGTCEPKNLPKVRIPVKLKHIPKNNLVYLRASVVPHSNEVWILGLADKDD